MYLKKIQAAMFVKLLVLWYHLPPSPLNVAHKLQRAAQVRAHRTI